MFFSAINISKVDVAIYIARIQFADTIIYEDRAARYIKYFRGAIELSRGIIDASANTLINSINLCQRLLQDRMYNRILTNG